MPDLLENIIKQMETPAGISKEAATQPEPLAGAAEMGSLQQALEKTSAAPSAGPASTVDPLDALMEKAAQLAGADQQANIAEASMIGAAMADGFLAKMAAAEREVKTAGANLLQAQPLMPQQSAPQFAAPLMAVDPEIEKVAGALEHLDTASMQKLAADAGYQAVMEKAAEDWQIGHDAALQEVADGVYGEFLKGAAETEILLDRMAARQQ